MTDDEPFSFAGGDSRPVALITGAASGIGAAFARNLASRGHSIIIVDKSAERAGEVAAQLAGEYHARAEVWQADLADSGDIGRVERSIAALRRLDLLINNAGFGSCGKFVETPFARQLDMIGVQIVASVRFCRAALPGMIARRSGGIINVSSLNAFTRFPETVTYSASKSFLLVFSECLEAELAGTGVTIQALCPGQTYTRFNEGPEMTGFDASRVPRFMWMSADRLAELSLAAFERGSGRYIPALKNRLFVAVFGNRLLFPALKVLRRLGILEMILRSLRKLTQGRRANA